MKKLIFEQGETLEHRFTVQFHGESNGDSIEALTRCLNPKLGHNGQMRGQKSPNLKFNLGK